MGRFFRELVSKNIIEDWANIIDWLLDDSKFTNWEQRKKGKMTRCMKNYFIRENIEYRKVGKNEIQEIKPKVPYYIYITSSQSESMDLVRHIRNGIAHSNCIIRKAKNGKLYIEIGDCDKNQNKRSALMKIPIETIHELQKIYQSIEKERVYVQTKKTKKLTKRK